MKRLIRASHTYGMEPSGYEYGKALEEGRKKANAKYAPFKIKDAYVLDNHNSDGYEIILGDPDIDAQACKWVAYIKNNSMTFEPKSFELYGPFDVDEPVKYRTISKMQPITTFKGEGLSTPRFDKVMNFMFTEYQDEIEEFEEFEDE